MKGIKLIISIILMLSALTVQILVGVHTLDIEFLWITVILLWFIISTTKS